MKVFEEPLLSNSHKEGGANNTHFSQEYVEGGTL